MWLIVMTRLGGDLVTKAEYEDFQILMDTTGLGEIDNKCELFTWTNKQIGNPIYSRIDRLLTNLELLKDNYQVMSDHAILYLTTSGTTCGKRQFRFNNCWVNVV